MINFKTEYNFLTSYATIDKIIEKCIEKEYKYVGICDIEQTFGNYRFYSKCIENSIKPVIGTELKHGGQVYLLYAKNYQGITRINELVTLKKQTQDFKFDKIEDDLILVLGEGELAKKILKKQNHSAFDKLKTIFSDIYFGVYSNLNNKDNYEKVVAIKDCEFKSIIIDEVKILDKKDFDTFLVLNAIKLNRKFFELKKIHYSRYLLKTVEDKTLLNMDNKKDFLNKINIVYPKKIIIPPKYQFLKDGTDASLYLKNLSEFGLQKRLNDNVTKEYQQRLYYELDIINKMGYADYFLIVFDIVKHAKTSDVLVGPGRGSAAASLVSYCLGITEIDPIKNGLIFERFLNPQRSSMPDIDLDFEDTKRNEIVNYIINRFGKQRVCKIATITKFLARSAFRDVAKVMGLDKMLIDLIAKEIDPILSFEKNVYENKKIQSEMIKNNTLKLVFDIVKNIEGIPRQTSIHAAGVLIVDKKLYNYMAIDEQNVSQLEASDIEKMGLLKFDILALSNLTFIHRIIDRINNSGQIFSLKNIDENDKNSYKVLKTGKVFGIFQMESPGMRSTAMKIKPDSISEIANVLSLYRPGPKAFIDTYVENKTKFKPKDSIDVILKDSNGIIVYQEQIILIANKMARYSLGEADILRRAISKKDKELIEKTREDFVSRSVKNGYKLDYSSKIYDYISKFASYGFNKAHAYSYATIVFWMSYLKTHYSEFFYAELFYYNFKSNKKDEFLNELKNQNIELLAPDLLRSSLEVSTENRAIRMGFLTIDGIGRELSKKIIYNRQYVDFKKKFHEIVITVFDDITVSKRQIDALVDAGVFDFLKYNHNTLKYNIFNLINGDAKEVLAILGGSYMFVEKEKPTFLELATLEKKILSINVNYHYFDKVKEKYEQKLNMKLVLLDKIEIENSSPKFVICLVKIKFIKEITTKNGKKMGFLTIESQNIFEVVVFAKTYMKYGKIIDQNIEKFIVIQVKIENGKLFLQKM